MAIKANIVVDQGSDFTTAIKIRGEDGGNVDLVGFSAEGQMRRTYSSASAVSFSITINTTTSELLVSLSSEVTTGLTPGRYVYDIELLTSEGVTTRIVEGIVTVTPQVTR